MSGLQLRLQLGDIGIPLGELVLSPYLQPLSIIIGLREVPAPNVQLGVSEIEPVLEIPYLLPRLVIKIGRNSVAAVALGIVRDPPEQHMILNLSLIHI